MSHERYDGNLLEDLTQMVVKAEASKWEAPAGMILVSYTGECPTCKQRQKVDPVDFMFDFRPSCSVCGEWLEDKFAPIWGQEPKMQPWTDEFNREKFA